MTNQQKVAEFMKLTSMEAKDSPTKIHPNYASVGVQQILEEVLELSRATDSIITSLNSDNPTIDDFVIWDSKDDSNQDLDAIANSLSKIEYFTLELSNMFGFKQQEYFDKFHNDNIVKSK